MKVAILGAPGAGKSSLARKVAWALNDERRNLIAATSSEALREAFLEGRVPRPWRIIDGYVEDLSERTGLAYGYMATFEQNLQVHFERQTREQEATREGYDVLTCGSLFETTLYCAIKTHRWTNDAAVVERFTLEAETTLRMLGMLHLGIDYDLLLYLPYDDAKLAAKGDDWDIVVDQKLPEVVESYWGRMVELRGRERENVRDAVELIRRVRAEAPPDDQLAVR